MTHHPERVAEYYDRNTRRFLRFGGAGETAAIHRRIWAPGVETETQAFEYLNRLVAEACIPAEPASTPRRLLDLGCGVGGTTTWLTTRYAVEAVGVSNSAVQVALAEERARRSGLESRCRFLTADFTDLPELGLFDSAYAIESFIHASRPEGFFASTARRLAPGGKLVICDDFLSDEAAALPPDHAAWRTLRRFTQNWHAINFNTAACAQAQAQAHGLRLLELRDLSAYVRTFHPLALQMVYQLTRLPLRGPYWQNLSGGSALQVCLRRGWSRYLVLIFEKEG